MVKIWPWVPQAAHVHAFCVRLAAGDNEKKIFEAVISKPVDFSSDPWPRISGAALDW